MYTTKEVAALYGVTIETARAWSEEFATYLSPTANPGHKKTRQFTVEDMTVFDLIATMKREGKVFEDIHTALAANQRGQPPALGSEDMRAIILNESEKRLVLEIEFLRQTLTQVEAEREALRTKAARADELERENIRLNAENEFLRERLKLEREIGEKEGELRALRSQLNQNK
ncbi:hypothetical protein ANRL4_05389 [Anaerolineae bacterium]|nr:hypothetical protein ANRL4_05389 [Anaerolineae bacterium]